MSTTPAQKAAVVALDKPARSHSELRQLFARPEVIEQVKMTLPAHMKPERLTKVLLSACLNTPMLMEVNQLSLLKTLAQLSELGLEPGSAMGHVYLIPFRNKAAGRVDVNVIIGYRGYVELARRSGTIEQIETHVVFKDDLFELGYGIGDARKLKHVPNWGGGRDDKDALLVYGIVRMKDGGIHVDAMSLEECRRIRNKSQAWKFKPNSGPWHDDFLEMCRKTVVRRICKMLSLSAEVRELEQQDPDTAIEGQVVKPELKALSANAGEDIAAQMASSLVADPDSEVEAVVDQATGEVLEAGAAAHAEANVVPEVGTIDHLLWRIAKADVDGLAGIIKEASDLAKDEPRRMEVSAAISARRKAVRS